MSFDEPRAARHPLCTCPELTWDAATGRADVPDLQACRDRAFAGLDPHPIIGDLGALLEEMKGRS